MNSIVVTGKTVEDALQTGMRQLDCGIADITYDVLEEGSKGLFGLFGGKPYKLRITVKEEEKIDLKSTFNSSLDSTPKVREVTKPSQPAQPVKDAVKEIKETKPQPVQAVQMNTKASVQTTAKASVQAPAQAPAQAPKMVKPPQAATQNVIKPATAPKPVNRPQFAAVPKPVQPKQPVRHNDISKDISDEEDFRDYTPSGPAPEGLTPEKVATMSEGSQRAYEFLSNVTRLMGVNVSICISEADASLNVAMYGDTLGILIGRRGETLDALQYLTSLQVNKGKNDYTRVSLDTENYRAKREESLRRLAGRMASRCRKTGRKVVLEPMNPYERRVLHAALQNNNFVSTHSEGDEPNRRVVITPNQQQTQPQNHQQTQPQAKQ